MMPYPYYQPEMPRRPTSKSQGTANRSHKPPRTPTHNKPLTPLTTTNPQFNRTLASTVHPQGSTSMDDNYAQPAYSHQYAKPDFSPSVYHMHSSSSDYKPPHDYYQGPSSIPRMPLGRAQINGEEYHHHQGEQDSITVVRTSTREGNQGDLISITCEVNFPIPPHSRDPAQRQLRILFNHLPISTSSYFSLGQDGHPMAEVSGAVPSWMMTAQVTEHRVNPVPIYVQVMRDGETVWSTQAGYFRYTSHTGINPFTGSQGVEAGMEGLHVNSSYPMAGPSRSSSFDAKRKRSGESVDFGRPRPQFTDQEAYEHSHGYGYPPAVPYYNSYDMSMPTMDSGYMGAVDYNAIASQPQLIRSTQMADSEYDAQPGLVYSAGSRAQIEFMGDLNSMATGWTDSEWAAKRRLVQFWRRQEGNRVFVKFQRLAQEEFPENQTQTIVSCVFREDQDECYITSVDTIYLLEALVGNKFSVEEKNRIRRNLEGFKPITVNKHKPDGGQLFKLIMGFPNPKPRNIEKDLKVFTWKSLSLALTKILSKYTASYNHLSPPSENTPSLASQSTLTPVNYQAPRMAPRMSLPGPHDYEGPYFAGPTSNPMQVAHTEPIYQPAQYYRPAPYAHGVVQEQGQPSPYLQDGQNAFSPYPQEASSQIPRGSYPSAMGHTYRKSFSTSQLAHGSWPQEQHPAQDHSVYLLSDKPYVPTSTPVRPAPTQSNSSPFPSQYVNESPMVPGQAPYSFGAETSLFPEAANAPSLSHELASYSVSATMTPARPGKKGVEYSSNGSQGRLQGQNDHQGMPPQPQDMFTPVQSYTGAGQASQVAPLSQGPPPLAQETPVRPGPLPLVNPAQHRMLSGMSHSAIKAFNGQPMSMPASPSDMFISASRLGNSNHTPNKLANESYNAYDATPGKSDSTQSIQASQLSLSSSTSSNSVIQPQSASTTDSMTHAYFGQIDPMGTVTALNHDIDLSVINSAPHTPINFAQPRQSPAKVGLDGYVSPMPLQSPNLQGIQGQVIPTGPTSVPLSQEVLSGTVAAYAAHLPHLHQSEGQGSPRDLKIVYAGGDMRE